MIFAIDLFFPTSRECLFEWDSLVYLCHCVIILLVAVFVVLSQCFDGDGVIYSFAKDFNLGHQQGMTIWTIAHVKQQTLDVKGMSTAMEYLRQGIGFLTLG